MSANSTDVAAFQVFMWNKRRFAIPISSTGEQLGPPLPLRNLNRRKRKGYGPGSSNTSLTEVAEAPPSSLGQSLPIDVVTAPPSDNNRSFSSQSSGHSSAGRSGRQRLSHSVSFLAQPMVEPAHAKLIDYPKKKETAPQSILQKKSSFLVPLRPLFDFAYEPPQTPRDGTTVEREGNEPKEGEKPMKEDVREEREVQVSTSTRTPFQPQNEWAGQPSQHIQERALGLASSLPFLVKPTDLERPCTPPEPHGKSDPGLHFPRTCNGTVSAEQLLAHESPPEPKDNTTMATVKVVPFGADVAAAAEVHPEAVAVSTEPAHMTPPSPGPSPRAASPARDAVALARTTVPSPPPDDVLRLLQLSLRLSPPAQVETTSPTAAGAATQKATTAAEPSPAPTVKLKPNTVAPKPRPPSTATTKTAAAAAPPATAVATTSAPGQKQPDRYHDNRSDTKETEVQRCPSAAAATLRKKLSDKKRERKEKERVSTTEDPEEQTSAEHVSKAGDAALPPPKYEVGDDVSLPSKCSDSLLPPALKTVTTQKSETPRFSNPPSKTTRHHSSSPTMGYPLDMTGSLSSSFLGMYEGNNEKAGKQVKGEQKGRAVSPTTQSNEDIYELFRYATPQPLAVTKPPLPVEALTPSSPSPTKQEAKKSMIVSASSPQPLVMTDMYYYLPRSAITPTPPLPLQSAPQPSRSYEGYDMDEVEAVSRGSLFGLAISPTAGGVKATATKQREEATPSHTVTLPPLNARPPRTSQTRRNTLPYCAASAADALLPSAALSPHSTTFADCYKNYYYKKRDSLSHDSSATDSSSSASYTTPSTIEDDDKHSDEYDDGEEKDEEEEQRSSSAFSNAGSDGASGNSCRVESPSNTVDSKTATTTTSSSSSDKLNSNYGSIWSTMIHRLCQPLIKKPSTEEDTLMYYIRRCRNQQAFAKSHLSCRTRVETVCSGTNGLSSVETEEPVNSLQRHRRAKKASSSDI